jgi:large subunit ribosomal protein L29
MDLKELRTKSVDELKDEVIRLRKDLFESRFRHGTRQLMDTASIRRTRRDVARALTVLNEKASAQPAG